MVEFRSPVLATTPIEFGPLRIEDVSATTKLVVKSDIKQFGLRYGASAMFDGALIVGSRPNEWYVLGTTVACASVEHRVAKGGFTNIIDYTHSLALFRLTGLLAACALEKVCNVDWSDEMTPDGAALSASVAKVNCDIVRNDERGEASYLIACDRSFGQYLWNALADACDEFDPRHGVGSTHEQVRL